MMKCDMCFDRTSVGKKPMCATVCPSQALYFGPRAEFERIRSERAVNEFRFNEETVKTKVNVMVSPGTAIMDFDVLSFMSGTEDPMNDLVQLSVWEYEHA
jgi:Fe-S-cluster-containing dehydrogenase component